MLGTKERKRVSRRTYVLSEDEHFSRYLLLVLGEYQLGLGACCHPGADRDWGCGMCMARCFLYLWKQWLRGWREGAVGGGTSGLKE